MHLRVRLFGKPDTLVVVESKLTKIEQLRKTIEVKLQVDVKLQRVFYGGKQLEDGYTLHDYNIKINDVIQLVVNEPVESQNEIDKKDQDSSIKNEYQDTQSSLYQVGDLIDVKDRVTGAWFEGKIVKIVLDPTLKYESQEEGVTTQSASGDENKAPKNYKKSSIKKYFNQTKVRNNVDGVKKTDENILYKVQMDYDEESDSNLFCNIKEIRPRARTELDINGLSKGETVMVNYNIDNPLEKGNWYDFQVDEINKIRTRYELVGTLYLGRDSIPQNNTVIKIHDKIFAIEQPIPVMERTSEYDELVAQIPKRSQALKCIKCRDKDNVRCRECGCFACAGKENPEKIVLCDECDKGYHMNCLTPPLTELPEDDWYCPSCKRDPNEVVAPGSSKQMKKSASSTKRDWGRGMACVGKTKTCAMPANHFGPIPGIDVGMCWRFRIQLSETGVHRPPVSGIHGRDVEGAYSIVLSGGYEDDVDHGYEFTYTGSGGRDLSGNKRTAQQSCDQQLTRENKALARNCAVKKVSEEGGDAGTNWRQGKPVRVVRSFKMLKHFPKYAPKEGLRYDGIYKVVKYYPEKGLSGYRVWKYLLRRDDPSPAPWESGAKQYSIIYPDGYLEAQAEKKALKENSAKEKGNKRRNPDDSGDLWAETSPPAKKQKKQKLGMVAEKKFSKANTAVYKLSKRRFEQGDDTSVELQEKYSPPMKTRKIQYEEKGTQIAEKSPEMKIPSMFIKSPKNQMKTEELSADEKRAIASDTLNNKLWDECLDIYKKSGKKQFIDHVTERFLCIICQNIAIKPVTTPCLHNFCMGCIKLAFKSTKSQNCPCCRNCLATYEPSINDKLQTALRTILAGYDAGKI